MFDEKRIAQIVRDAAAEKWPYPKTFYALKEAGVSSYEVWIEDFRSVFKSASQEWEGPIPIGFQPSEAASDFSQAAVQNALKSHQRGETTYVEFLKKMTTAGVVSYKVDMPSCSLIYRGRNDADFYTENVPPYNM